MFNLERNVEALIFSTQNPISSNEIISVLANTHGITHDEKLIEELIQKLIDKYQNEEYSFEIVNISEGYTFMTKGSYHRVVAEYLKLHSNKKLTKSALETLSIIAYKQPITKAEIEQIRGVNADYTINKLMEKDLVEIAGRQDGPGKPLIYITSEKFMDYFGLKSILDLPKLKEIQIEHNEIGELSLSENHSNQEEE
ncbi:MAG TPA: SMC-Scp complex subunit ScpB [Saprospiraceae bacterium]|nr:SMC-Scp complex subunit ScpB [Saprospiraceae bacterium]